MRRIAVILVVGTLFPLISSAQSVTELQAQINALLQQIQTLQNQITNLGGSSPAAPTPSTTSAAGCPAIARTLSVGMSGTDVKQLQQFLKNQNLFSEEPTGYFGSITESAVKRLQVAHTIVSSGTANTTGYGAVGPRTRALITSLCGGTTLSSITQTIIGTAVSPAPTASTTNTSPTIPLSCPLIASVTPPNSPCTGTWERAMSLGCHVGWRCNLAASSGNKPPVIARVDGPTSINVGTFGTWQVVATDPEGSSLSYNVTWGDEGAADILNSLAGFGATYTSFSSATHSFSRIGKYTVAMNVKDNAGQISTATFTITVTASGATNTTTSAPISVLPALATSTPPQASCITPWGSQVVHHLGTAAWQPFFTEGFYFNSTSTPVARCENGGWKKCDPSGQNCQAYNIASSTPSGALPSYTGIIGTSCPRVGATMQVSVPPGTQLCQWLSCSVAQSVQTVTLTCRDSGWFDTNPFRNQ